MVIGLLSPTTERCAPAPWVTPESGELLTLRRSLRRLGNAPTPVDMTGPTPRLATLGSSSLVSPTKGSVDKPTPILSHRIASSQVGQGHSTGRVVSSMGRTKEK